MNVNDNVFREEEAVEVEIKKLDIVIVALIMVVLMLCVVLFVGALEVYKTGTELNRVKAQLAEHTLLHMAMMKDEEGQMREVLLAVQRLVLAAQRAPIQKMIELAAPRL